MDSRLHGAMTSCVMLQRLVLILPIPQSALEADVTVQGKGFGGGINEDLVAAAL